MHCVTCNDRYPWIWDPALDVLEADLADDLGGEWTGEDLLGEARQAVGGDTPLVHSKEVR